MIKSFIQFSKDKPITEEFRQQVLALMKEELEKDIPEDLKIISAEIRKDLVKNGNKSFEKSYNYIPLNFKVVVDYTKGTYKPYSSNVWVYGILESPQDEHSIPVKVQDNQIDINYLLSIIIHEVRHIYDILTIANEYDIMSFIRELKNHKYKNTKYSDFTQMVYLSLEHELVARHNMLYPLFRWVGVTDKTELMKLYKQKYVYQALVQLQNFNAVNFINKFNIDELIDFTNIFITEVAMEDNICKTKSDVINHYKKWEEFFIEKSKEFLGYVDSMFDDIINDIKADKVYEKETYSYKEPQYAYDIFKQFYKQIFKKENPL